MRRELILIGSMFVIAACSYAIGLWHGRSAAPPPGERTGRSVDVIIIPADSPGPGGDRERIDRTIFPDTEDLLYRTTPASTAREEYPL